MKKINEFIAIPIFEQADVFAGSINKRMSRKKAGLKSSFSKAAAHLQKVWIFMFILIVSGCTAYHPMPITSEALHDALTPPDMDKIQQQIDKLKFTFLKPMSFDDRDGLSPDEAAILSIIVNPALRALRDQRGIASAQLFQAGILPNPQLSYSLDAPSGGTTINTNTGFIFGLGWEVTSLISRQAHVDTAQAKLQSIDLSIAWQEWQIAQAARLSAYRVLVLKKQYKLAGEVTRRLDNNRHLIERALNDGQVTQLQESAAETAFNHAHQRQLDLDRLLRKERLQLKKLIGLPADAKIKLQSGFLPNQLNIMSYKKLTEHLTSKRLDLLGLERGYASQEATLRAAILEQFPKINIGLTYSRDTSNLYTTGFGISIDLPIFDRNQGRIALERATRHQLFDEYANRLFEARADVARLAMEIGATNRLIYAANEAVPPLQRLVTTYRLAIKQGQADILSYYSAWNNLTDQRIKLLSLKERLIELRIALEFASGRRQVNNDSKDTIQP